MKLQAIVCKWPENGAETWSNIDYKPSKCFWGFVKKAVIDTSRDGHRSGRAFNETRIYSNLIQ